MALTVVLLIIIFYLLMKYFPPNLLSFRSKCDLPWRNREQVKRQMFLILHVQYCIWQINPMYSITQNLNNKQTKNLMLAKLRVLGFSCVEHLVIVSAHYKGFPDVFLLNVLMWFFCDTSVSRIHKGTWMCSGWWDSNDVYWLVCFGFWYTVTLNCIR